MQRHRRSFTSFAPKSGQRRATRSGTPTSTNGRHGIAPITSNPEGVPMRKFSVTRADVKRILIAGTIVAVLDGTFAFCAYVVVAGRYNFESLLQYTASGLLGNDAFGHHGLTGWLLAALGATLHFAISFTVAAVFFVALRRFARTSERTVALGLLYGAGVWMFNAGVVLPGTGARHEPFFGGWYIPFLVDHALFVGLPIALVLARHAPRLTMSRARRAPHLAAEH
jgi:hypothetical protein